ncbi:MAG: cell wall hydrolase [Lachnospiraceae bacterium]|nr:cell wall hydrolase [Lachnospiraceae bacterium]
MLTKIKRTGIAWMLVAALALLPITAVADDQIGLHAGVGCILMGSSTNSLKDDDFEANAGVSTVMQEAQIDEIEEVAETALEPEEEIVSELQSEESADLETIVTDVEVPADLIETEQEPVIVMANVEDAVNVRVEPSEDAEIAGKLFAGCGGELLERRDGWTRLKSGELEGWTKDEFLFFGEEAEAASKEAGTLTATVNTETLRIRKETSEDAGVIDLVGDGQELRAVEELGDWVSVKYDGEIGYVASEYVDVEFSVPSGKTIEQIRAEEEAKKAAEAAKKAKSEKSKKGGKSTSNRGAVETGASDVTLLAALIQCEAGREGYDGQLAVGAVVMNRVRSGSYPSSISGVITQPSQFPPATNGRVASVLASGPSASCIQAAQAAIAGQSNVGGATHFGRGGSGITIGNHTFW